MKSPEAIAAIPDQAKRVAAASTLIGQAEAKAEEARVLRDMAAIVAHLDDGVPPVEMYRDVLGCSRGLFNRIIQRAPETRPKIDNAKRRAKDAAKRVRKYEALAEEARVIRDRTALAMMRGRDDEGQRVTPTSNADIARLTGLSTARVAQMRTGSR